MSNRALQRLEQQLLKVHSILLETEKTIERIATHLKPLEEEMMRREFETRTAIDYGVARVVLCVEGELAESKTFRKALSKMGKLRPTVVRIPELQESRVTNLTIARMLPGEILSSDSDSALIVNLQKQQMLRPLEESNTAIIGKRYFLDTGKQLENLVNALFQIDVNVLFDNGLNGGELLTYELVQALLDRSNTCVLEMTLSQSIADNSGLLERVIRVLSSAG